MNITLYNHWINVFGTSKLSKSTYVEVIDAHESKGRFYHTSAHIEDILVKLEKLKALRPSTIIAAFYHDYVYSSLRNDNEERSAQICVRDLQLLKVSKCISEESEKIILCTKNHSSENNLVSLFLDIDMSIIGSDNETYDKYIENVRNEYSIYPDFLYNKGRKKFLLSLLKRDSIFITSGAQDKWEKQSLVNIKKELSLLL